MKVNGDNHTLVYKAKKYTLKRRTINLDLEDNLNRALIRQIYPGIQKNA
jgi:hypothetical protein